VEREGRYWIEAQRARGRSRGMAPAPSPAAWNRVHMHAGKFLGDHHVAPPQRYSTRAVRGRWEGVELDGLLLVREGLLGP
jgi:hypothetical protein